MTEPGMSADPAQDGFLPKSRLDGFADGVLAIVITLLVLGLKVPPVTAGSDLLAALGHEWRDYVGYLISFVFVGGVWIAHSAATSLVIRGDAVLFRLNLLLLFFVSLMPFFTAVMTTYMGRPDGHVGVGLYGLNLFIASVVLSVFIRYAGHHPDLVADDLSDSRLRQIERNRRLLVLTLGAAALLALVVPDIAVGLYLAVAVAFIVAPLLAARSGRR